MIASIMAAVGSAIGGEVIKYLKEHAEKQQLERMQGEILEGWLYKIQVAIRDEHRRNNVPLEVHQKVMTKVEEVAREEFDTTKI
jgi:hypothetical protein